MLLVPARSFGQQLPEVRVRVRPLPRRILCREAERRRLVGEMPTGGVGRRLRNAEDGSAKLRLGAAVHHRHRLPLYRRHRGPVRVGLEVLQRQEK